jgi:hypothetical protein
MTNDPRGDILGHLRAAVEMAERRAKDFERLAQQHLLNDPRMLVDARCVLEDAREGFRRASALRQV